ncbi:LysR family transcriptional regulator [Microbacterium sp. ZW T5_56]|uniref:LysR family transcriptional regulator n=1 Tax=Microbacterium sp. ZW T5_56 TaxID=3378081 RepID=UPI0038532EE3
MQLEHVRSFLAIVDSGSFRAAALLRNLSQPALTKQMQSFERWAGTELIDRSHHGATLSPAGRALVDHARALVARADAFGDHTRRVAEGRTGTLSVGFGMSSLRQVPAAIRRLRAGRPDLSITLEDLSSTQQQAQIRDGILDVGFGRRPATDRGLVFRPVWTDRLAYATSDRGVDPTDIRHALIDRPLARLARDNGPGLAQQVEAVEHAWSVRADTLTTTHDLLTLIAITSAGVGPAIIPLSSRHLTPPHVQVIPIPGPEAEWIIGATWRAGSHNTAVSTLVTLAEEVSGELLTGNKSQKDNGVSFPSVTSPL